jgi:hypothetical protein
MLRAKMSIVSILILFSFLIILFSQFGNRLAARNSLAWWLISLFLTIAVIDPEIFRPLTQTLGIALVSNFVLASMVMFLVLQLVELSAESTQQTRKFRDMVSRMACEEYVAKNPISGPAAPGIRALVILPCYNEEQALPQSIEDIQFLENFTDQLLSIDFCYVNDGSADRTLQILQAKCSHSHASHKVNIGVAGVLLTGFRIAQAKSYDYVVQCDSDGQHPIRFVPDLVKFAHAGGIDLLVGSRFVNTTSGQLDEASTTWTRVTGIIFLRQILKIFGHKAAIFDPTSGFRVYSEKARDILMKHMPDEYPEPESIAILTLKGARIAEHEVSMLPRQAGVSTLSGLKSARFMLKVVTALVGLRLRNLKL